MLGLQCKVIYQEICTTLLSAADLNNTLPHISNMYTRGLAKTKLCPLCNNIQSLLRVVAGFAVLLDLVLGRVAHAESSAPATPQNLKGALGRL